jgi:hypothetical protein
MEMLQKSDFIILHNTSVAMEALNYKIPIFRYFDEDLINLWNTEDKFSSLKEFEKLFEKMKNPKEHKKLIDFYEKEFQRNFFIPKNQNVQEHYYSIISNKIKNWKK